MKATPTTVNVDKYRALLSEFVRSQERSIVFVDTNVLIWMFRLNNESFKELQRFFSELAANDQLVIPNWVVHEYNNLLASYSDEIFFPFKKRLKVMEKEMGYIVEIARLVADNEFSKKHNLGTKREFLKSIESEVKSLASKIQLLNNKNNYNNSERRTYIEKLVSSNQSAVPLTKLVSFNINFQFRLDHRIPPGFEDAHKEHNRFGDVILWNEMIENCVIREIKRAVFISLDVKKDWVFSPTKITIDKTTLNSDPDSKYYFLTPWLTDEFKERTNGDMMFCNMRSLIDVLYSPDYNPIQFGDFKNLAKTVDIELKNSETNKVIEWLIMNPEKLDYLNSTVCKWKDSPEEVDTEELRLWCLLNIKADIDFSRVEWSSVFVQLFI